MGWFKNKELMRFSPLKWHNEESMSVGGIDFDLSTTDFSKRTTSDLVILLKDQEILSFYEKTLSGIPSPNILEFGTWEGGSPIFFASATNAKRIVGIDLRNDPSNHITEHASKYKDRLRLIWGVSQSDRNAVEKALNENFDGPIDLVIDDASHNYEHTRAAFDIVFPRLREGGTYIVEDWNWSHYKDPHYDDYWKDLPSLSNLAFEFAMAVGSRSALASMQVSRWCLVIKKGSGEFTSLDDAIRLGSRRKFAKL